VPLTEEERGRCDEVALRFIRQDIGLELAEYYGAAVFYGNNVKPEQPNNQLRNALNHLARAYEASDWASAQKQIELAEGHVTRAKRDSLKLATIGLFDEIRQLLRNAEYYYGPVNPTHLITRGELIERRRRAYARESAGHADATNVMLALFVDAKSFLDQLQSAFPAASARRRLKIFFVRIQRQVGALAIGFALGVSASLSANYIWEQMRADVSVQDSSDQSDQSPQN
jgi:hypothetical protein